MKRAVMKFMFFGLLGVLIDSSIQSAPQQEMYQNPLRGYVNQRRGALLWASLVPVALLAQLAMSTHAEGWAVIRERHAQDFAATLILHAFRAGIRNYLDKRYSRRSKFMETLPAKDGALTVYTHNLLDRNFLSLLSKVNDFALTIFAVQFILGVYRRRGNLSFWRTLIKKYLYKPHLLTVRERLQREGLDTPEIEQEFMEKDCLICLDQGNAFAENWLAPCSREIGHVFHRECIAEHLMRNSDADCPSCRSEILRSNTMYSAREIVANMYRERNYIALAGATLLVGTMSYGVLHVALKNFYKYGVRPIKSILWFVGEQNAQGNAQRSILTRFVNSVWRREPPLPTINEVLSTYR